MRTCSQCRRLTVSCDFWPLTDDPRLLKIVESERRRRLMAKAADIAERAASRGGAHIDDELAEALFAYAKRRAVAGSDTGSR